MRRAAAVLTLLLLLQWTLGSTRLACDMNAPGDTHAAMTGMSSRAHGEAGANGQASSAHLSGHGESCDGSEGMTAAQCAVVTGCAASGALVPAVALDAAVAVASAVPASTPDAPISWQARPELPPPRA